MAADSPIAPAAEEKSPLFSNKTYDKVKFLVTIVLPALGALYAGLAGLWGFPHPTEVVGTITLVATFLGVLLNLSGRQYETTGAKYDGVINVLTDEDGVKHASLELKNYENPADVVEQKEVTFRVNPPQV